MFYYCFANIIIIRRKQVADVTVSWFCFIILFLFADLIWLQKFAHLSVSYHRRIIYIIVLMLSQCTFYTYDDFLCLGF